MLIVKKSSLYVVSNIFDTTSNVRYPSVNSNDTSNFNSPPIIIDKVRIISSYFIIHFIFFITI